MKKTVLIFAVLFAMFVSSCSKETTVTPTSGSVTIVFDYEVDLSEAQYQLFTELSYTSNSGISALYTGTIPAVDGNGKGKASLPFTDLLPGNYVFVIGNHTQSLQVIAGRTTTVTFVF